MNPATYRNLTRKDAGEILNMLAELPLTSSSEARNLACSIRPIIVRILERRVHAVAKHGVVTSRCGKCQGFYQHARGDTTPHDCTGDIAP